MHYFNGLQQKEITIYKKSNIKTALNCINVKSKMCAVTKGENTKLNARLALRQRADLLVANISTNRIRLPQCQSYTKGA